MKNVILILGLAIFCLTGFSQETGKYTDPRDGKVYKTVKIGEIWIMAQNLAYKPTSGKYWVCNDDTNSVAKYGYLYDWETANKIAPKGWHLPSQNEWSFLHKYIGNYAGSNGQTDNEYVYLKMLDKGSSGFNAMPYGKPITFLAKSYPSIPRCDFWSSTEQMISGAYAFRMISCSEAGGLDRGAGLSTASKSEGLSVRLFHDYKGVDSLILVDNNLSSKDSIEYPTVKIGDQVWMKENLKVTHYRNGDPIDIVTEAKAWETLTIGAYCWHNNDTCFKTPYGALYNWYAVNDARNLCPIGWHVPSDIEWLTLIDYLGGLDIAGDKLREISQYWFCLNESPSYISGFSGLPSGSRDKNGAFGGLGSAALWWSNTQNDNMTAWYYATIWLNGKIIRYTNKKSSGKSVRCIKDN